MSIQSLVTRARALSAKLSPGPRRKPTTAESRQELDRVLALVEARARAGAPANTEPGHPSLEEAYEVLDGVLAEIDRRDADDAQRVTP